MLPDVATKLLLTFRQPICRWSALSSRRRVPAANAAARGCTSLARWYRRPLNASRGAGRLSSTSVRNSPAGTARRLPRRRGHVTRVFRAESGQSPAKAIENLRLEAARFMLDQGRLSVEEIARATGFGDRERMRRSFVRTFGQTRQNIRNASHPLATI